MLEAYNQTIISKKPHPTQAHLHSSGIKSHNNLFVKKHKQVGTVTNRHTTPTRHRTLDEMHGRNIESHFDCWRSRTAHAAGHRNGRWSTTRNTGAAARSRGGTNSTKWGLQNPSKRVMFPPGNEARAIVLKPGAVGVRCHIHMPSITCRYTLTSL